MLESIWNFIIDFVSKPDQVLLSIIEKYNNWVYVFLFAIIFAETGLIVASFLMPFLPGDALFSQSDFYLKKNLLIFGL
jgi:membrane-associated protein